MADFFENIQDMFKDGIPVDVKVNVPVLTLVLLGVILFLAILLSQTLSGLIVAKITGAS